MKPQGSGTSKNVDVFVLDQRGGMALATALMGFVLISTVGLAIDTARIVTANQILQDAADAAALAGAVAFSDASQQVNAQKAANANFSNAALPAWLTLPTGTVDTAATTPPAAEGFSVTMQVSAHMQFTIMSIIIPQMKLSATATAINPITRILFSNAVIPDQTPFDWNGVWAYAIPRNADGSWNYGFYTTDNSGPTAPLQLIDNNCVQFYPPYNPPVSTIDPNNQSRCWIRPSNALTPVTSIAVSATTPVGYALTNQTAGRWGTYASDPNPKSATGTDFNFPWGYVNQYGSIPANVNWFYSGFGSVSRPPDYMTDSINLTHGIVTIYKDGDGNAISTTVPQVPAPNYPTTLANVVTNGWGVVPGPLGNDRPLYNYSQNCSLLVTVSAPNALPPDLPESNGCYQTGSSDSIYKYGNLSCAQMGNRSYTYWWNDMGGPVDYFNFMPGINGSTEADASYVVNCNGGLGSGVRLIK